MSKKKSQFRPNPVDQNLKSDFCIKDLLSADQDASLHIFSYPDDEGIKKNGGRPGASLGPQHIKSCLYKMTPAESLKSLSIYDHGHLDFGEDSLQERHDFALHYLKDHLKGKALTLGGGHDYAYVDGAAFIKSSSLDPLIINFDAHYDLRNLEKGITSGTPFYRLTEEFGESFDLFEVGIQKHCNSTELFHYAQTKKNIHSLTDEDLYPQGVFSFENFRKKIESQTMAKQDCYISVDIDGFKSSLAPGCSQSWPSGFDYRDFMMMFDYLLQRFEVRLLGVYEVSPPLDHGDLTARLAALISYRYIESCVL